LALIGISLGEAWPNPQEAFEDPTVKVALFIPQGWGRDYLSASNFFVGQFHSPTALAENGNASLVGASSEQLSDWGYDVTEVPNVDTRIEACVPLTGAAQLECWAALDQHMMENVASFVPLGEGVIPVLTSSRVMDYHWDELSTAPSYDRIQLPPFEVAPATAAPLPSITTDPALEGVWETERLTGETIAATLSEAGLDPEAAEMIVEAEGFEEYVSYRVQVRDGRWVIYVLPDGEDVGWGWLGAYEVVSPGRVTATDGSCTISYGYDATGDELAVDLIDDPCGEEDVLFQTVIFESGPFSRVE
jgi:hypothetical protein